MSHGWTGQRMPPDSLLKMDAQLQCKRCVVSHNDVIYVPVAVTTRDRDDKMELFLSTGC